MENDNKKKIVFSSFMNLDDSIYEMIHDKQLSKTSFVKISKSGQMECLLDEVDTLDTKYKPYSPNKDLITKKVIQFPSLPAPYESNEELIKEITEFVHKYLDVSAFYEVLAVNYVLFTWLYDKFNEVPYLRAIGDFGSGKSRFLQVIGSICYKPMFMGGSTTPSPVFRIINEYKGTMILDEGDFKNSDMSAEIIKILNSGYQKGVPVLRSESKGKTGDFDVKAYDVFCPKILATREKFKDKALESRCLTEEMGLRLRSDIPRTLESDFHNEAEMIRNKLLMFRLKNYFRELTLDKAIIEGIHPRLGQILIPILTISEDKNFKDNLKEFILKYNEELIEDRGLSRESDIIFSILKLENQTESKKLTVKQITDELNTKFEIEERLIPRKVGWYLRDALHLKPYKTRDGYILDLSKDKKRLLSWKERFGIKDQDISSDLVNDMNFAEVPTNQVF